MAETTVEQFINDIPPVDELRERLARNLRERRLLRKIICIAEQREKVVRSAKGEPERGEG